MPHELDCKAPEILYDAYFSMIVYPRFIYVAQVIEKVTLGLKINGL